MKASLDENDRDVARRREALQLALARRAELSADLGRITADVYNVDNEARLHCKTALVNADSDIERIEYELKCMLEDR